MTGTSTARLVVGVAAAISQWHQMLLAGVARLVSGALSMPAGEYVSVSSQADTERADLALESSNNARVVPGILTRQLCGNTGTKLGKALHLLFSLGRTRPFPRYLLERDSGNLRHVYNETQNQLNARRTLFAAAACPFIGPTHGCSSG